jgi:hypothetical protein
LASAVHLAFEGLKLWISELLVGIDGSDPETETVGKELTSTSGTGALDEWSGSEVFEARTWRTHILSATVSTFGGVSEEGVTHPHGVEADWAFWDLSSLRVNSKDGRWSFTDVTSGDVLSDVFGFDGHGWHSSASGQPVRFSVSTSVSADLIASTESSWHGVEFLGT